MMYNDRFVSLIKSLLFYAVVWVICSLVVGVAAFLVSLPFLFGKQFETIFLTLYLSVQVGFTIAYIYAIIDSIRNPKITEKEVEE